MSKLPQITPKKLVKFFLKEKFVIARQAGSHLRLNHTDGRGITIAMHNKPIAPGTLQSILKQAEMSRDEFLRLFSKL